MATTPKLTQKHWKALELLDENTLSFDEICKISGFSESHLRDLYQGDIEKAGPVAGLFFEELRKITARKSKKIKQITKDAVRDLVWTINERVKKLKKMKPTPEISKELALLLNTLAKSAPQVEIGSISYTQGLTAEELANEFRKLTTIAQDALVGAGISRTRSGESGEILIPSERGNPISEESQASLLRAESETGELSPE